jgi:hypothetical protein
LNASCEMTVVGIVCSEAVVSSVVSMLGHVFCRDDGTDI